MFYLTLNAQAAAMRGDYGTERYEQQDFQKKTASVFENLQDDSWKVRYNLVFIHVSYKVGSVIIFCFVCPPATISLNPSI